MTVTPVQHHIDRKNIEEDEISLASRRSLVPSSNCRGAFCRVILALVFIGLGVGALVYSVSHHTDSGRDGFDESPHELNPFRDQYSEGGTFTLAMRKSDDTSSSDAQHHELNVTIVSSQWYQDHTNRRIKHSVGVEEDVDWQFTLYVTEVDVYKVTGKLSSNNSALMYCEHSNNTDYESYIKSFGFEELHKVRNGTIVINVNEEEVEVVMYQGEPTVDYHGSHSTLMNGYVRPTDGVLLGWETFFQKEATTQSSLFRTEYWYGNMKAHLPDAGEFRIPGVCKKSG